MSKIICPDFLIGLWGKNCKGMLGMVSAPGRMTHGHPRNLFQDLKVLKQTYKTDTIVSLIGQQQQQEYKIAEKKQLSQSLHMNHLCFPIADFSVPGNLPAFKSFVQETVRLIHEDQVVVAHCAAGMGRTGLFAASCLVSVGIDPIQAIQTVRSARKGTLETKQQEQFVKSLNFTVEPTK